MFLPLLRPRGIGAGALSAGAIVGVMLCVTTPPAAAEPPTRPPNCTAADIAVVATGVAAALSTYLLTHPDLNGFYTGLQDQPKDQIGDDVENYFNANPQQQAELENIRRPMVDIKQRCQWTPLMGEDGVTP